MGKLILLLISAVFLLIVEIALCIWLYTINWKLFVIFLMFNIIRSYTDKLTKAVKG